MGQSLSRDDLVDGLRHQRAYVRTRGVADSPELELTATDGTDTVMIGGTLVGDLATLQVTLRGATGQAVDVVRNGLSTVQVPVVSDPFTVEVPMIRSVDGGPLGTFYRVDVREPTGIRSIVSNPIWLAAAPPDDPEPGTSAPFPRYPARPRRPRTEAAPGPPSRPRAATRWRSVGVLALLGARVLHLRRRGTR